MRDIFFYTPQLIPSAFNPFPKSGLECWVHNTFFKLIKKSNRLTLHLVSDIPEKGIIIFHKGHFPESLIPNKDQFFICIQADYGRHQFAQFHICQNPFQLKLFQGSKKLIFDKFFSFTKSFFVPHWHQPNIIQRDVSRTNTIKNIGYLGLRENIPLEALKVIEGFCKSNELSFRIVENPTKWNDYSDLDLIIAIRSFESYNFYHKPYSKIVNALKAKCIVIAGRESSSVYFKEKYFSELKLVKNTKELTQALEFMILNSNKAFLEVDKICFDLNVKENEEDLIQRYYEIINLACEDLDKWINSPIKRRCFLFLRKRKISLL